MDEGTERVDDGRPGVTGEEPSEEREAPAVGEESAGESRVAAEAEGAEEEIYVAPELKACVFTVGGREFSVELEYLSEIAELAEVVPLPLSPPYIEGITHLRGMAIPVINFAVLKDLKEEKAAERRLLVLEIGRSMLGIAVNEMPDLSTDFRGELISVPEFFEAYRVK